MSHSILRTRASPPPRSPVRSETVPRLLAAGADVDARDDAGRTSLDRTGPGTFGKRRTVTP